MGGLLRGVAVGFASLAAGFVVLAITLPPDRDIPRDPRAGQVSLALDPGPLGGRLAAGPDPVPVSGSLGPAPGSVATRTAAAAAPRWLADPAPTEGAAADPPRIPAESSVLMIARGAADPELAVPTIARPGPLPGDPVARAASPPLPPVGTVPVAAPPPGVAVWERLGAVLRLARAELGNHRPATGSASVQPALVEDSDDEPAPLGPPGVGNPAIPRAAAPVAAAQDARDPVGIAGPEALAADTPAAFAGPEALAADTPAPLAEPAVPARVADRGFGTERVPVAGVGRADTPPDERAEPGGTAVAEPVRLADSGAEPGAADPGLSGSGASAVRALQSATGDALPEDGAVLPLLRRLEPGRSLPGVRIDRLPQIGTDPAPPDDVGPEPAEATRSDAAADARPRWQRHSVQLAPDERPPVALILFDPAEDAATEAAILALPGPATVALAPFAPDAPRRAAVYAAAGHEVVLSISEISALAGAGDLEVLFAAWSEAFPDLMGVLDPPSDDARRGRLLAPGLVALLSDLDLALIAPERGLSPMLGAARSAGVPALGLYRELGAGGESPEALARMLDRIAFEAERQGRLAVLVQMQDPIARSALADWLDGRGPSARRDRIRPTTAGTALIETQQAGP